MTITIQRERKTLIDLTIEVPAYYEHGLSLYKIFNACDYIEVCVDSDDYGLMVRNERSLVALFVHNGRPITEEKFVEAFDNQLSKLNQLTNSQSINAVANQTEL